MEDHFVRQSLERPFQDLRMVFCGSEKCKPLHSWGPVVRPTYIIHYILEGEGIFQIDNDTWHLHEKEGFLIEPETQTFYQADQNNPWTYCWFGFEGTLAPLLVRELGLGDGRLTFCCDQKEELQDVFSTIFEHQKVSELNDLVLESQLYRFFAILMKNLQVKDCMHRGNFQSFQLLPYSSALENVALPLSYAGVSRRERRERAAEMLNITGDSIEQIASSCGYQDAVVFSKAFKKKYGISPRQFRKNEAEKLKNSPI